MNFRSLRNFSLGGSCPLLNTERPSSPFTSTQAFHPSSLITHPSSSPSLQLPPCCMKQYFSAQRSQLPMPRGPKSSATHSPSHKNSTKHCTSNADGNSGSRRLINPVARKTVLFRWEFPFFKMFQVGDPSFSGEGCKRRQPKVYSYVVGYQWFIF